MSDTVHILNSFTFSLRYDPGFSRRELEMISSIDCMTLHTFYFYHYGCDSFADDLRCFIDMDYNKTLLKSIWE